METLKILIPETKGRNKTTARGFWLDNGRVYYDYVKPVTVSLPAETIPAYIERERERYNQLAMFYIVLDTEGDNGHAIIQSADYKIETLPAYNSIKAIGKRAMRAYIKKFIELYQGCTVYDNGQGVYTVEAWHK